MATTAPGRRATAVTSLRCPWNVRTGLPDPASQTRTVPPALAPPAPTSPAEPVTRYFPSGVTARALTDGSGPAGAPGISTM